jgi:hypothetical protein
MEEDADFGGEHTDPTFRDQDSGDRKLSDEDDNGDSGGLKPA